MAEAPNVPPRLDFLPSCETPSGIRHPQETPRLSPSIPARRGHGVPLPPHVLSGGGGCTRCSLGWDSNAVLARPAPGVRSSTFPLPTPTGAAVSGERTTGDRSNSILINIIDSKPQYE